MGNTRRRPGSKLRSCTEARQRVPYTAPAQRKPPLPEATSHIALGTSYCYHSRLHGMAQEVPALATRPQDIKLARYALATAAAAFALLLCALSAAIAAPTWISGRLEWDAVQSPRLASVRPAVLGARWPSALLQSVSAAHELQRTFDFGLTMFKLDRRLQLLEQDEVMSETCYYPVRFELRAVNQQNYLLHTGAPDVAETATDLPHALLAMAACACAAHAAAFAALAAGPLRCSCRRTRSLSPHGQHLTAASYESAEAAGLRSTAEPAPAATTGRWAAWWASAKAAVPTMLTSPWLYRSTIVLGCFAPLVAALSLLAARRVRDAVCVAIDPAAAGASNPDDHCGYAAAWATAVACTVVLGILTVVALTPAMSWTLLTAKQFHAMAKQAGAAAAGTGFTLVALQPLLSPDYHAMDADAGKLQRAPMPGV